MYVLSIIRRVSGLFEKGDHLKLAVLIPIIFVGSSLEVLGIGLVIPFLGAITDPGTIQDNSLIGPLARRLGGAHGEGLIAYAGGVLLAAVIVKNCYLAMQWNLVYRFVYSRMVRLSDRLFTGYLTANYSTHLNYNSAELIRNVTVEVNRTVDGVVKSIVMLGAELLVVIGIMVLLFVVQPLAAVSALLFLGLVGVGIILIVRPQLSHSGNVRLERQAEMIKIVNQAIGGIRDIKVLKREEYFVDQFHQSATALGGAFRRRAVIWEYPRLTIETAAVAGILVLLIVLGVVQQRPDASTLPIVALFGVAAMRLIPSVNRMVTAVNQIRFLGPAVEVVQVELAGMSGQSRSTGHKGQESNFGFGSNVIVEDLTFLYPGVSEPTLRNVTLEIPSGQIVGLVGTSGSGKTTLANLLLGLVQPKSGRILVDGLDIQTDLGGWGRQVGYVPQDVYIVDDTIRRNVAFGIPDEDIEDVKLWHTLEAAQLGAFVKGLPEQMDTLVGDRGVKISGGQRQRIGIARSLYGGPSFMVFDEATSSLDPDTENQLTSAIAHLGEDHTILLISHRISTVENCDAIYLLDQGRVSASGTYEELASTNLIFKRLLQSGP